MKFVFLAPFGIRPKGTVIARMLPLASELQQFGHVVTIVAPPYTNPEDSGKVEVVNGVRLINVVLPSCGKVVGALPLAWRMFRATLYEKPDLVHLFKPKGYGGLAAMLHLSLQWMGIKLPPLFVDADDWEGQGGMNELQPYTQAEKRFFDFQEQWLLRHAWGVTAASRELERLTSDMGVASQRILYLPNCVADTAPGDGSRIREKFGVSDGVPVVLLYTRFFEFSQERLYRIFAGIHSHIPDVRFLVVGKGKLWEEDRLKTASHEMGFDVALVMAGWVEPKDIPDYMSAADVAIYPMDDTNVNRAKCPAKLTELLISGVPVVADGVGQALEYISNGISGELCDPGNPEQMITEAVSLLQDTERRNRLSSEGKRSILKRFNWRDFAVTLVTKPRRPGECRDPYREVLGLGKMLETFF